MVEHHNSGGGGRYYKDESSRRSRKYYSSPHNYSTYSSYSSNPNPFPPSSNAPQAQQQQQQQQQSHSPQSNLFSSRRNDSLNSSANPEVLQPQSFDSPTPASSSPSSYSSRAPSTSNGNWYHTSQPKRINNYRTNRPSISNMSASNPSRRSVPGSYREDLMPQQASRYTDYNGYIDSYQHDHYSNGALHKKSGFSKPKYNGQFGSYPKNNHANNIDYREFQSYRQNYSGSLSGKQSLMDSKTPTIDANNYKSEKSSSQELPRTDSEDHDLSDIVDTPEKYAGSNIEKPISSNNNDELPSKYKLETADKEDKSETLGEADMRADNDEKKKVETKVESISKIRDEAPGTSVDKSSGFDDILNKQPQNDDTAEKTPETFDENTHNPDATVNHVEKIVKDAPEVVKDVFALAKDCLHSSAQTAVTSKDSQTDIFGDAGEKNISNAKVEHANSIQSKPAKTTNEPSDDEHSESEGCIFPMLENQYRAWELKRRPKFERRKNLKYLNKSRLKSLSQYNFLDKSFLIFKQADAFILFDTLKENAALIENKKTELTEHYIYSKTLWQKDVAFYDKQLEKAYESENDSTKKPKIEEPTSSKTTSSRRSRHHGDSVRTEAEFMEILASLEQERERDPLIRAQYGAAIIPDMILDPIEKYALNRKMDSNNLVRNKDAWAQRILTDPIDTFTEAEHAKFCELYTLYPKKFGRISHDMGGLRTSEDCVLHYYKTKKTTNYKQLVANKNKKPKKKSAKKKKDSRTKNDAATSDTSNVENEISVDNSKSPDTTNIIGTQVQDTDSLKEEVTKRKLEDAKLPETKHRKLLETGNILAPPSNEHIVSNDSKTDQLSNDESEVKIEDQSNADISSTLSHVSYVNESLEDHPKTETELDHIPHNIDEAVSKNKKHKKKDEEKPHISSYWSVQDINNFPLLLEKFGSRWEDIAEELGTKSATMVKNYYQRGLVEHPNWQSFLAISRPLQHIVHPADSNDSSALETEHQRRPSMGYFYKPATSYATSYPNVHQILPLSQQPSVNILNDKDDVSRLQHVPHFVPISQTAPLYAPYVTEVKPIGNRPPIHLQGPMPVMPARNGVMNMSSLLNSTTGSALQLPPPPPPPQQQSNLQLPPLNVQYNPIQHIAPQLPPPKRGPSIMNLLNSEDVQPNNKFESNSPDIRSAHPNLTTRTAPFKPNISNIMNSPVKMDIHNPETSVPVYQQSQQTQQPQGRQNQQTQQDQESHPQSAFMGGTSALDALARIAFERK